MNESSAALLERARAWLAADPDPETRAELGAWIERGALDEIARAFDGELEFGTAGLRGVVGPGPARMNRANVIRATRAVAEHLLSREPDAKSLPVIVGFDARLSSRGFAEDAAAVLRAAGLPVRLFPEAVPTPLVAHAARAFAAPAAIVVTASHNPREYNGYKLYGGDAVQIVSPADAEIRERIGRLRDASAIARAYAESEAAWAEAAVERYLADILAEVPFGERGPALRIAYSPLHGVGLRLVERAFALAGLAGLELVAGQAEPDGHFPTTPFPNPEEPGVMDPALELGAECGADLVLVNDPDADRLAVAAPLPSGRFEKLSGNEIGLLLADYLLERAPRAPRPLVVSSLVSSPLLDAVAAAHGAELERTNTGFKWIWTAVRALERTSGVRFAFAYEEALGYSVARSVRDKDGISAALCFAALSSDARARNESVFERLYGLYRKHGLCVSAQHNLALGGSGGLAWARSVLDRVAASPPPALAGCELEALRDYRIAERAAPRWRAPSDMLELRFERGVRALLRPSGTEPKLKIYVDLTAELGVHEPVGPARERALAEASAAARELGTAILAA